MQDLNLINNAAGSFFPVWTTSELQDSYTPRNTHTHTHTSHSYGLLKFVPMDLSVKSEK